MHILYQFSGFEHSRLVVRATSHEKEKLRLYESQV